MKLAIVIAFAAIVALGWVLKLRKERATRRRRRRKAHRYWGGYAKAWDSVFGMRRPRRLTYMPPPQPTAPSEPSGGRVQADGADGGT